MKQSSKKHELGTAALYCRLSRDDNMDSESNSIQNQRMILEQYAREKGFINPHFLYDDGFSGTNFNRPGWNEVMRLMENGMVRTVIVKDYCAIIGLNQKDLENQGILA